MGGLNKRIRSLPVGPVLACMFALATLVVYANDERPIARWGMGPYGDPHFERVYGVAFDPAGYVYVIENSRHKVHRYTTNGVFVNHWGSYGTGVGQFLGPYDVAVDPYGNVWVSDPYRLQEFTPSGELVREIGGLSAALGVATDSAGNVYVAESGRDVVKKFSPEGALLGTFAGRKPRDVAIDPTSGDVLVINGDDATNNRIDRYHSTGEIATSGWVRVGAPQRLDVDAAGNVYVTDSPGSIGSVKEFSPAGALVHSWTDHFFTDLFFSQAYGIAVDSSGTMYVGDWYYVLEFAIDPVVVNEPPVIVPPASTTAFEGVTLSSCVGFNDLAADGPWTATVDYGDGSPVDAISPGPSSCGGTAGSLALNHLYAQYGAYTVTVTVTDHSGMTGSATIDLTVLRRFSRIPAQPEGTSCISTPWMVNTDPVVAQNWFVKAGSSLAIQSALEVHSYSVPATLVARVFDPAGVQVGSDVTLSYVPGDPTDAGRLETAGDTVGTIPGEVYRVEVTTPGTLWNQTTYMLGFAGAVDAAMLEQPVASLVGLHGAGGGHPEQSRSWQFNVDAGEQLAVRFFTQGTTPAGMPNLGATTARVQLFDLSNPESPVQLVDPATGAPVDGLTLNMPAPPDDPSAVITTSAPAASATTYRMVVLEANGYYRLEKQSGFDRGIYIGWRAGGYANFSVNVTAQGTAPAHGLPWTVVRVPESVSYSESPLRAGVNNIDNHFAVGSYRVTFGPVSGYTIAPEQIDFDLTCRGDKTIDVTITDIDPPTLTLIGGSTMTIEAGSSFLDPGATATDTAAGSLTAGIQVTGNVDTGAVGSYTLTYSVSDGVNTTSAIRTVNVADTTPPQIVSIVPSLTIMEPPNNKMVPISLAVTARDNVTAPPVCGISSVSESEPPDGGWTFDWAYEAGSLSVSLRASTGRRSRPRIYNVYVSCTDGSGNSRTSSATVTVVSGRDK